MVVRIPALDDIDIAFLDNSLWFLLGQIFGFTIERSLRSKSIAVLL